MLSNILCMVLIVAMALLATGCNGNKNQNNASRIEAETVTEEENQAGEEATAPEKNDGAVISLGEGTTQFTLSVVDQDGNESLFEIHTNQTTVGDALQELELIEGEEGEYGLYVKTVNNITADYDKDGVYWAFYIGGEYAMTGVDATQITEGESYSLKVEK